MTYAIGYSVAICFLGAALEGLFAGRGVRQRLGSLRLPSYALPFWGRMVIGVFYYVICFAILCRLFLLPSTRARNVAFRFAWLTDVRQRALELFLLSPGVPYSAIALALLLLLGIKVDRVVMCYFLPYVIYLFYGNLWGIASGN